jgi:hypothetical protein
LIRGVSFVSGARRLLIGGAAVLLLAASGGAVAHAASGGVSTLGFAVKLEIGVPGDDARACTGSLVRPRVVVTAQECLDSTAHPDPTAAGALPITARFATGAAMRVVDVRPNAAPGLALVVLARPAPVAAVPLATAAAAVGEGATRTTRTSRSR